MGNRILPGLVVYPDPGVLWIRNYRQRNILRLPVLGCPRYRSHDLLADKKKAGPRASGIRFQQGAFAVAGGDGEVESVVLLLSM